MGLSEYLEQEETSLVKVEEGQLIIAEQMRNALIMLESQKKQIEADEKAMKAKLEEVMRENNIVGYESNDKRIKISLGADSVTETVDKDKLFLNYPDIYKECVKESPRKGSLRITIRDKEE